MYTPVLIIIGGFAGAGKTTVAAQLSRKHNLPLLGSDAINDALRPALHKTFKEASPVAYEVLWHLVRKQLNNGVNTIVDTHMATPQVWESIDALKRDIANIKVIPIILQADLDIHRARIEERGRTDKDHLNLGGDKLEDVLFKYEFIEKLNRPDLIRIDANGSPEEVYAAVEKAITEHLKH